MLRQYVEYVYTSLPTAFAASIPTSAPQPAGRKRRRVSPTRGSTGSATTTRSSPSEPRAACCVEPWPDTQTLVSIDTWTLPTPQTLVSIDTSQTRSDTAPTRSDTPNWRFRQVRRVGRVYRVSIVSNSDTLTLLTRPTRLATHVSPHKSPRMPTAKLGMQPMGLLGGSNPWPWPFGTTTPSTSAVGRHPDTSDTSDTQTLDTQTRSDTTHASQLSRALRHRLDTGQTPLTLLTPVSIDTAQTRLRHCSDTPDTPDTQTQQGSRWGPLHVMSNFGYL